MTIASCPESRVFHVQSALPRTKASAASPSAPLLFARRVQRNLSAAAPVECGNRGLVRRRLRLTRNPTIPCILVECGNLTSPSECSLLKGTAYRDKLARAIASAIREQAACGDAGMGPLPKPIYAPLSSSHDRRE